MDRIPLIQPGTSFVLFCSFLNNSHCWISEIMQNQTPKILYQIQLVLTPAAKVSLLSSHTLELLIKSSLLSFLWNSHLWPSFPSRFPPTWDKLSKAFPLHFLMQCDSSLLPTKCTCPALSNPLSIAEVKLFQINLIYKQFYISSPNQYPKLQTGIFWALNLDIPKVVVFNKYKSLVIFFLPPKNYLLPMSTI